MEWRLGKFRHSRIKFPPERWLFRMQLFSRLFSEAQSHIVVLLVCVLDTLSRGPNFI